MGKTRPSEDNFTAIVVVVVLMGVAYFLGMTHQKIVQSNINIEQLKK